MKLIFGSFNFFLILVTNRKEYHDLEKAIIPLFKKKLKLLQMSSNSANSSNSVLKSSRIDQPNFLESLLKANKSKFKCGSKRSKFWTLNKVGPPPAPHTKCQKVSVIGNVRHFCLNQLCRSTLNKVYFFVA